MYIFWELLYHETHSRPLTQARLSSWAAFTALHPVDFFTNALRSAAEIIQCPKASEGPHSCLLYGRWPPSIHPLPGCTPSRSASLSSPCRSPAAPCRSTPCPAQPAQPCYAVEQYQAVADSSMIGKFCMLDSVGGRRRGNTFSISSSSSVNAMSVICTAGASAQAVKPCRAAVSRWGALAQNATVRVQYMSSTREERNILVAMQEQDGLSKAVPHVRHVDLALADTAHTSPATSHDVQTSAQPLWALQNSCPGMVGPNPCIYKEGESRTRRCPLCRCREAPRRSGVQPPECMYPAQPRVRSAGRRYLQESEFWRTGYMLRPP